MLIYILGARGLKRRSAAARLLISWIRIPPRAWTFFCCDCCLLSGRGLCDELITDPEEFYRLWCVVVCDPVASRMRRSNQSVVIELNKRRDITGCISYMPLIVTVKHDCWMSSDRLQCSGRLKKDKRKYFGCKMRNQDKSWAPHICCVTGLRLLTGWVNVSLQIPFGLPIVWNVPKDHSI
jgi:hypothetical protein